MVICKTHVTGDYLSEEYPTAGCSVPHNEKGQSDSLQNLRKSWEYSGSMYESLFVNLFLLFRSLCLMTFPPTAELRVFSHEGVLYPQQHF